MRIDEGMRIKACGSLSVMRNFAGAGTHCCPGQRESGAFQPEERRSHRG
ncbi:hypothetical protein HMPREF1986_01310 [Oribacterium sp. oral taxon 078 str. F0263]|nr:hypothetical protein HMPREF1986_01310 [Oribacterium sp. oral taxon 078 str. F0263]